MTMTTLQCQDCQTEISVEEIDLGGRKVIFQRYCDDCCQKRIDAVAEEDSRKRVEARRDDFWSKVPTLYQNTDIGRLNPVLAQKVLSWNFCPIGIGIRGASGSQKTRAAVALLYRLRMKGFSIQFLKATDISRYSVEQFSNDRETQSEAMSVIRSAKTIQVLLIDDLGKGRMAPAAEELLYDILDKRSERELPVIWTANATAKQLHSMMTEDRGDAIMRRLVEFTTVISI